MIELKRLKLINWHNFENVTFDCARLTYMIGVNAVGKTDRKSTRLNSSH